MSEEKKRTLTVGELKNKLSTMPVDMAVCVTVRLGDNEELQLEEGDDLMGDARNAYVNTGCGSASPVCMIAGDRGPSVMDDDDE